LRAPGGCFPDGEQAGDLPPGSGNRIFGGGGVYAGKSTGAAERFSAEIRRLVTQIEAMPRRHGPWRHGTRRARARHFPYLVVFAERPSGLRIVAVAHPRKHPDYWRDRLS